MLFFVDSLKVPLQNSTQETTISVHVGLERQFLRADFGGGVGDSKQMTREYAGADIPGFVAS